MLPPQRSSRSRVWLTTSAYCAQLIRAVDSGADLNAYAKVENQAGCCSPDNVLFLCTRKFRTFDHGRGNHEQKRDADIHRPQCRESPIRFCASRGLGEGVGLIAAVGEGQTRAVAQASSSPQHDVRVANCNKLVN
jgi:hypothetical protein